jgi:hypothetical protein
VNITYPSWAFGSTLSTTSFFDIGVYSKNFSSLVEAGQYVAYQTGISFRNYKTSASGRSLFHNSTTYTKVHVAGSTFPYNTQLASINSTALSMTYKDGVIDTLNYTDYTTTDRITPHLVAFKTSRNATFISAGSIHMVISYTIPSMGDIVVGWLPSIISLAMLGMVLGLLGKFSKG